jgi:hypothetical protein
MEMNPEITDEDRERSRASRQRSEDWARQGVDVRGITTPEQERDIRLGATAIWSGPSNSENFDADQITNLTPHEVVLVREDGSKLHAWPSVGEARATTRREVVDTVVVVVGHVSDGERFAGEELTESCPVYRLAFGAVAGLPDPEIGTAYIVSRITAEAARDEGRSIADLLIPDDIVRDPDGQPIGCRGFARL